ncbi:MAG: hypothetical protein ACKVQB_06100 [Bacteroidia bacterium]
MKPNYKLFVPLCLVIFSTTCKRVENQSDTGLGYFPLSVGMSKIFSVDSINYNVVANQKDSLRSYLKEVITTEKTDSSGYTIYKAEYYTSIDTNKGWKYSSYFFYKKNEYHINIDNSGPTVTCFVFPVAKGRRWNINAYNNLDAQNAYYSFVANPWMNYNDCVEVFVKEDINTVEEAIDKRVYCRKKGLVYKILSDVSVNNSKKNGHRIITKLIK